MADLQFAEAFRTEEFVVEIEGIASPGVTKVSGLSEGEVESKDQHDGGSNIIHKVSAGIIKYDDLTLTRYMDGTQSDADWKAWWNEMFNLEGTGLGSQSRRNGSVVKKQNGTEVLRFVFEGAWIKSSKFSDLDAATTGLMQQTIVMAVERLYRA